uniref:Uncharacterized protein n=5 Tax=Vibrionaceae TaxID=641 RepID=A0A0H3ZRK1_VIBSP|nr:hypothetical protein [Vibrio splendidus]AKN37301.1 hypothetical protein [Aliivibrio fischeri]AKN38766.1 hypothetical protein [Enterovibrio norvegicus]AKN39155.1 hypothetical protein [Vibrio kanaloae]AKN40759.1 hypothetical protein [Vibrio tasmaniensis]
MSDNFIKVKDSVVYNIDYIISYWVYEGKTMVQLYNNDDVDVYEGTEVFEKMDSVIGSKNIHN